MPSNLEICHIRFEQTREEFTGGGLELLLNFFDGPTCLTTHGRYIAEVVRATGNVIIAETPEFIISDTESGPARSSEIRRIREDSLHFMIHQLLNDGWEIMTTNDRGEVQSLKRQIGVAAPSSNVSPAELLKQLAALRDAGILSEAEFQAKKASILSRI